MITNTPTGNKETGSKRSSGLSLRGSQLDEESVSLPSDMKNEKPNFSDSKFDSKDDISISKLVPPVLNGDKTVIPVEDERFEDRYYDGNGTPVKRDYENGVRETIDLNDQFTGRKITQRNSNRVLPVLPQRTRDDAGEEENNGANTFLSILRKVKNEAPVLVSQDIDTVYLDRDQRERLQQIKYLIRSHSTWKLKWDILIMIFAIFNCFAIPVDVAFEPGFMDTWYFLLINSIIDFIFLLDLIINFRTTFIHAKTGKEIIEPSEIAITYLQGRFWIDLLATIPFDTFAELIIGSGVYA